MKSANRKRKILLGSVLVLIIAGFVIWKTDTGRRYTAKVLDVEFIPNQYFDLQNTNAFLQKDSVYKDFRNKCPFHYQMLGVQKFADSSFVFILSEPADYVVFDSIAAVFHQFNIHAEIKTHPVGYDGWMKDVVICVGRATSGNIDNLSKKLNEILYLSDYKSFTEKLPLDTSRIYFSKEMLNYRISLAEINQWFIKDKEVFLDLSDTSKTFSIPDIFQNKKNGVFYSKAPGFVIWSLKKIRISPRSKAISASLYWMRI